MPVKERLILGVDISHDEIRVVEMRGTWASAQVVRAGVASTPPGALSGNQLLWPEAVGDALRGLLQRLNIATREAVIGVAAPSIITRTLDMPVMPNKELRTVIEGELAYQRILPENRAVFDFMRLSAPDSSPQVLVMAAEDEAVRRYAAVAERAGLRLAALEPTMLALYRAAVGQIQDTSPVLCISLSDGKIESAIVDHGELRIYRRIDIGSDNLVTDATAPGSAPVNSASVLNEKAPPKARERTGPLDIPLPESGLPPTPQSETPLPAAPKPLGQVNAISAGLLSLELGRSLEYFYREFPQAGTISRAVMATNDPALEPLAEWLSQSLMLEVDVAASPVTTPTTPGVAGQEYRTESLRYLGATGLALHALANLPAAIPSFDLSARERARGSVELARRKLAASLVASIAILAVGIGAGFAIGTNANAVDHELFHAREDLESRQSRQQVFISTLQTQQNQLRALKQAGFPVPRVMDAVAGGVAPQAGLTEVSLAPTGKLTVGGEAANESAVIATLQGLKGSPYFADTSLDSWDSTANAAGRPRVVKFQISSQLAGVPRPATPAPNGS